MADGLPPIREIRVEHRRIHIVTMPDPRLATENEESIDWLWQHELEGLLYNAYNGALYRLLGRSAAGNGRALPLKKKSVTEGLLTNEVFVELRDVIHPGCRSITLVPIDAVKSDLAPTDEDEGPPLDVESAGSKRRRAAYTLEEVTPALEAELAAFARFRTAALNMSRLGAAVVHRSASNDRANLLRLLGWFAAEGLLSKPTLAVFASANAAMAVQRYVESLASKGRKYSTLAGYVGSCVVCARYVIACRQAKAPATDGTAVVQLAALHAQCLQQARQQTIFDSAKPPTNVLEWDGVMEARRAAEEALARYKGASGVKRLRLTRDATLLVWLTTQPPDRVGVARTLRLGNTLQRTATGFTLDLGEGAHKTSKLFGPTSTTVPEVTTAWLTRWIELSGVPAGGFLFHTGDPASPYTESAWSHLIKAIFARYSDVHVALAPKDLRSSFVGFLKSGEHDDATLQAAAAAMKHSSKTQASLAYDKRQHDRNTAAAMAVAADYAAKFPARVAPGARAA